MSLVSRAKFMKNLLLSKYEPLFCELLIEHMSEGQSFHSFAGKIGVTIPTIKRWEETHEEFATARELGEASSLSFWEKMATEVAVGRKELKNFEALKFKLKNTHPDEYKEENRLTLGTDLTFVIDTGIKAPEAVQNENVPYKSVVHTPYNEETGQLGSGTIQGAIQTPYIVKELHGQEQDREKFTRGELL